MHRLFLSAPETFRGFIKTILSQKYRYGLKFFISNAKDVSNNGWLEVFSIFTEFDSGPFAELSWSSNKVSSQFFGFFSRNKKLASLFLSNYIDEEFPELITQFCEMIPKLDSVKKLVLDGSEGKHLRENCVHVFEVMKRMKSLTFLNVSNNIIKMEGINKLTELISANIMLTDVSFDQSNFESAECQKEMIKVGRSRPKLLRVNWPTNDLTLL